MINKREKNFPCFKKTLDKQKVIWYNIIKIRQGKV